jgi:hypothetical protein
MIKRLISIYGILAFTMLFALAQTETVVELVAPTAADKELATKAIAAAKAAQGTPAQEQANFLMNDWPNYCLKILSSDTKVTQKSLDDARGMATGMYDVIKQGPTWPKPEKVVVPFATVAPVIDGKLDDAIWAKALTLTKSYSYNKNELLTKPATTWKVAWDKNNLYFAFDCEDEDIIAPTLPRDGMPFKYDCVEVFLLPEFKKAEYWELVIGATGSIYDGLNIKKLNNWGSVTRAGENFKDLKIGTKVDGTVGKSDDKDKKYIVEVAVPFKELPSYNAGIEPKTGDIINSIIARMDLNGDVFTPIAPFPVLSWGHNIWNYAPMELGK